MAKKYVPAGVLLTCNKGTLPAPLNVTFNARTTINGQKLATDLDMMPGANIPPLGVCAITKVPCVFLPTTPWSPVKSDVRLGPGHPLLEDSKLLCAASGQIEIHFSMAAAQAACAPPPAPDKSVFDQADDYLKSLGPLGDYGRFQLGVAEGVWEGGKGLAEGLWGLAKGGWNAVTHPVETANAIQEGAAKAYKWAGDSQNWADAAASAKQGVSDAATWASNGENWQKVGEKMQSMSPRDWGKITGQVAFEVGLTAATAGAGTALNAAAKTSRVARVALQAAKVADVEGHVFSLASKATRTLAGKMKVLGKVVTGAKKAKRAKKAAKVTKAGPKAKKLKAVAGCSKNKRTCVKDPIDVATGVMLFDQVDLELPGPIPFAWARTWYSNSEYVGPLGYGWHHCYDLALVVEENIALRLADGRLALFEPLSPHNAYRAFNRHERLELQLHHDQYRVFNLDERLYYCFSPRRTADGGVLEDEPYVLSSIENANGFAIRFAYDADGRLHTIQDSANREVRLRLNQEGRIEALEAPRPEGNGYFAVMQHRYDEAGNMITAVDALGQAVHYGYEGHLMVRKTLRTGLSFYFEYAGTGPEAKCVRTWGDGNILNGELTYEPGKTTVSSSLPGDVNIYHHQDGLVTTHLDPVGAMRQWTYNAYSDLTLERDPLGQATSYDYDARGNLTQVTHPDGAKVQTQFKHDLPVAAADALGNQWQWAYDDRGNQISCTDPDGLVTDSSYRDGLLHMIAAPAGPPTLLHYDEQYNLREVLQPDGQRRSWQHDALGQITALTDTRGNTQRRTYDLLGQLRRVDEPGGNTRWLTYDAEGNVLRARDDHQDVALEYTGLDWLAARTQAGEQVRYQYDVEGRLTRITNEHGHTHQFTLDAAGRIVAETRFDGQKRRYQRDAAGQVLTQWAGEQATRYAYDPAGRITAVTYPDGSEERFIFRSDGTLLEARNKELTVTWERDSRGRVLQEMQGAHRVSSTYDAAGQRIGLHSSLGAAVVMERDDYGDVARLHTSGWQARFERDAQGLEVARKLSGGVQTTWYHDQLGRPISQQITTGTTGSQHRRRHYRWQGPDQLTELTDSATGTTRFAHDARGALSNTLYPDGQQELRLPDAVGNLFQTPEREDRQYGLGGQLLQANGTHYRYDERGNLIEKDTAKGQRWHYGWNGAGQLARVTRPDGTVVSFTYDALGRRISKRYRGKVTRWVWDGNKPLHEWSELELDGLNTNDVVTWLFEEASFAPLAKLAGAKRYSIVTDHLGTPLEMVDERGQPSWSAELGSYGQVRLVEGTRAACPFRYQGQYEDVETGLYYNRFRYYDPEAGSYISQDPIGLLGGLAPYAYVQDPQKQVDYFGLSGCGAVRKSNPWNEFQRRANQNSKQFKNSKQAAKAYRHFQKGEYEQMAELLDLSSPHGKAVFWSGDLDAAKKYANSIGGTVMEQTPGGNLFNDWDYLNDKFEYGQWGTGGPKDAQPLWKALSARYASQARGPVTVVRNKVGKMWEDVEKPILETQGNPIKYINNPPLI